jgi:hypothetical protein
MKNEVIKFKLPFIRRVLHKLLTLNASEFGDELFLKTKYRLIFARRLDLEHPTTYSAKLQWLKLNDRRSEYTRMVDKIEGKKYVASVIGDEYIIPTLKMYDSVNQVNFDELPKQFVIKCTHDSGSVIVCKDKDKLDKKKALEKLNKGLKQNFYYQTREYPYRSVKPRLIAEQYMEDESGYELKDYKIFCFNGQPKMSFVASDRQKEGEDTKFDFYDLEWNHIPVTNGHPCSKNGIPKPKNYEKMLEIAAKLSEGIPHVRVDLYNINGKIYFGELTFFHWSGFMPYEPDEWDYKFGSYLQLPSVK